MSVPFWNMHLAFRSPYKIGITKFIKKVEKYFTQSDTFY